jgi:hypothetical protein
MDRVRIRGSVWRGAAFALALTLPAAPAAGTSLSATYGRTTEIQGEIHDGGPALSLGVQWPLGWGGLEGGVTGFAADLGAFFEELTDPGTGQPAGSAEARRRTAYGASFRLDVRPTASGNWEPFASSTWGVYRLRDDRSGTTLEEWGSIGVSLGGGIRRRLRGRATLGLEFRYHRLFNETTPRYTSAALEWGWR